MHGEDGVRDDDGRRDEDGVHDEDGVRHEDGVDVGGMPTGGRWPSDGLPVGNSHSGDVPARAVGTQIRASSLSCAVSTRIMR